jgi:hypothetical protein
MPGWRSTAATWLKRRDEVVVTSLVVEGANSGPPAFLKNGGAPLRAAMVSSVKLECATVEGPKRSEEKLAAVMVVTAGEPA